MKPPTLDLIGHTPLVRLVGFDTGPCELYLKLESQNPGGSIKDRVGVSMIEAAERSDRLHPGDTIVEATAGNTGIGLALVAAIKGYRLILIIPDKMSPEKIAHARALGAEIVLTRSDVPPGHPAYYQDMAARIASEKRAYHINQFANEANPLAHETTTGPEIWEQMEHRIDALVCGIGSGGTLTGLSRYFARVQPQLELVLADPMGSVLGDVVRTGHPGPQGSYAVEGIGGSCVPAIADLSRTHRAYNISDSESFLTARELLRITGIFGGPSSGTLLAAALRYCREQTEPKRVMTFVCDTGAKYLSKMYNDYWLLDNGYLERPATGNLRELITRRYEEGGGNYRDARRPAAHRFAAYAHGGYLPGSRNAGRQMRWRARRIGLALCRSRRSEEIPSACQLGHDQPPRNRFGGSFHGFGIRHLEPGPRGLGDRKR